MAIGGIGTEIVSIRRIKSLLTSNRKDRFLQRVYTPRERAYCQEKKLPWVHYAGIFAAKEAVHKALNLSWDRSAMRRDVEILTEVNGAPVVSLHRNVNNVAKERGLSKILLSISHGREYAVASCILQTDECK